MKAKLTVLSFLTAVLLGSSLSTVAGECGDYRDKIAKPLIKPPGEISVSASSVVRFQQWRSGSTLRAVVNGQSISPWSQLNLEPGKNIVDFVVTGSGDRHRWVGIFKVDGEVVFHHKELGLPRFQCNGELYRYRITFNVKPEKKKIPHPQPAVKRKYSAEGKDCVGLVYESIKVDTAEIEGCISRAQAAALLERPLIIHSGPPKEGGYQFLYLGGQRVGIATCSDYITARKCGAYAGNKFDISTDSQFARVCGTLGALSRAKQPIASYISDDPVNDLHRLPAGLLPVVHNDEVYELFMYSRSRMTVAGYVNTERAYARKWPRRVSLGHAGASMSLNEIARSDVDGDGFEDSLVGVRGDYGGFSLMLLMRYYEAQPRYTIFGEYLTCDDQGACDLVTEWSPWPVDKEAPICASLKLKHEEQ